MAEEKITGYGKLKRWVNQRIRTPLRNSFVGEDSGKITTGDANNFVGYRSGYYNSTGHSNNFVGYESGYYNISGATNTFVGCHAGYSNATGIQNVSIGAKAGYYETGNNKLFIDNTPRANEADARIKALIYGVFAPATTDQRISLNGRVLLREIATYADDAAAGAAGLVAGETYKLASGSVRVKL